MSCSRARGCHGERLDTFGVQARPFCEAGAYVPFGELPNCRTAGLSGRAVAHFPDEETRFLNGGVA